MQNSASNIHSETLPQTNNWSETLLYDVSEQLFVKIIFAKQLLTPEELKVLSSNTRLRI
jgi:hypothetical protein